MFLKYAVIFLFCIATSSFADTEECIPKNYGYSSTVCVCNATYCDTLPRPSKVPTDKYVSYTSTQSGLRFSKEEAYVEKISEGDSDHVVISTDSSTRYQSIFGFGGAFTDSTGINIKSLNNDAAQNLLRAYFAESGIEYNLGRVPIGGTDFSTHGYSYNDGDEDPELLNFELATEDYEYKMPLIKLAQNLTNDQLKLYASIWTAPKWMKHNGLYTGPDVLRENMYQPWANYFLKFLRGYANESIDFWGISTGNEPSMGLIPAKINSVGWLPWQMSKFIVANLGPTLRNSEFSSIKIVTIDDQMFMFPFYINLIFLNEEAKSYVDGFGVHYYWNWLFPTSLLTETHNQYPDKFILATEACLGVDYDLPHVKLGDWKRAETYAGDIIKDLNNWVTGWIDWNLAVNEIGGPTYIENYVDSPIIVNATAGEFYKQPMFYALGHFSKFLLRDSVRISFTQSSNELMVTVFIRPDNGTVYILLNTNDYDVSIKIAIENGASEIRRIIPSKSIVTILHW